MLGMQLTLDFCTYFLKFKNKTISEKKYIGSRRPSITSIHSGSSIRSYSAKRYERERQQKEEREMQKRLSKLNPATSNSNTRLPPTPSPHSVDEPFPLMEELKKVPLAIQEESSTSFQDELPGTSKQYP